MHVARSLVLTLAAAAAPWSVAAAPPASPQPRAVPAGDRYAKKGTQAETVRATLAVNGLPNLEGTWYYIGPFDNTEKAGFEFAYPPEKAIDLKATYPGKGEQKAVWKEYKEFKPGKIMDLARLFPKDKYNSAVYLYHMFESPRAFALRLSLGSDDTISVFFNGKRLLHEAYVRPAAPDQDFVDLPVKEGKNELLLKICQEAGGWEVYANPADLPAIVPEAVRKQLAKGLSPHYRLNR